DAANRPDRARYAGELELPPQPPDVHVDDVRAGIETVAPHGGEQVAARDGAPTLLGEREQHIELDAGEIEPAVLDGRASVDGIESDAGHAQRLEPARRTAQDRAQAGEELRE